MMRQSASRNQRSKGGFRLKLVLQICLLLAICTWLLYQVKHSHDKKKAFEDKISKIASKVTSKQPYLFGFSSKSIPLVKEKSDSISEATRAKDDDNEEEEEEEGEQDQNMKQEEAKDEDSKRDGEDAIDELDQDRGGEENDQEEEFFSEEEKESGQGDEDGFFDNKDGEDSAQEAREENYKRDDASSAVAHDSVMEIEDSKGNDLESSSNGTLDDAMNINNEAPPISNVSDVPFVENVTVTNGDLSVNGSDSTEVSSQNELKLTNTTTESLPETESNVSDNNSLAIQNGSKFNDSVSNTAISHSGSPDLIPIQAQHNKSDATEARESEVHPLNSTAEKNENKNGVSMHSDSLTDPVIQNEVKHSEDKAAE